ncbi:MAG: hypothetical protein IPG44_17035 [Anaerolineales bacterium]|jgi:hypothetical protein|nr:hypothetical protein [Anaerolineales bacterium]
MKGITGNINRKIDNLLRRFLPENEPKIFCISLQRTGTTSTGRFFRDHGYSVATYEIGKKNLWTTNYFEGNYEYIFKSKDFRKLEVFEDDPWWLGDFYRVLYHRFSDSKFILLERNADKWFDSMMSHSHGMVLGNTHIHCSQYQRLDEFYKVFDAGYENFYTGIIDNALPLDEKHRVHYTNYYKIRNREVKQFFDHHDGRRLFTARLEDDALWQKIGNFFDIDVGAGYNIHANRSDLVEDIEQR